MIDDNYQWLMIESNVFLHRYPMWFHIGIYCVLMCFCRGISYVSASGSMCCRIGLSWFFCIGIWCVVCVCFHRHLVCNVRLIMYGQNYEGVSTEFPVFWLTWASVWRYKPYGLSLFTLYVVGRFGLRSNRSLTVLMDHVQILSIFVDHS